MARCGLIPAAKQAKPSHLRHISLENHGFTKLLLIIRICLMLPQLGQ